MSLPLPDRNAVAAAAIAKGETVPVIDAYLLAEAVAEVTGVPIRKVRRLLSRQPEMCKVDEETKYRLDWLDNTRALNATEIACEVARRAGVVRGMTRAERIAERAALNLLTPPKEKRVTTQQHPWKLEKHGRSIRSGEGGFVLATLHCEKGDCTATETVRFRQLCGSADMDAKFKQKGWAVDPAKCPSCNPRAHRKDPAVATLAAKTSPAAIAAQAKMFGLLQTHFDPDQGCYGGGYSDAKVAAECGLALELVAGVRSQVFGDLKEPPEIAQLASDIEALSSLIDEAVAPLRTELAALRARMGEVRRKFAA